MTEEQRQAAILMHYSGMSDQEIAERVGVGGDVLARWLAEEEVRSTAVTWWRQGAPRDRIAERLAVEPEVLDGWINVAEQRLAQIAPYREPSSTPVERRDAAKSLLASCPPFSAEVPSDPEVGSDHVEVWFDDEAAHVLSDLVDQSVAVISSVVGVTSAWREDTEFIMVYGTMSAADIQSALEVWWRDRLGSL